jgi:hypothetical protein
VERRGRDSNPRTGKPGLQFSRLVHSTALPPLRWLLPPMLAALASADVRSPGFTLPRAPGRGGRVAEGTRLLSEYGGQTPSRVRIPPSPFARTFCKNEASGKAERTADQSGHERWAPSSQRFGGADARGPHRAPRAVRLRRLGPATKPTAAIQRRDRCTEARGTWTHPQVSPTGAALAREAAGPPHAAD